MAPELLTLRDLRVQTLKERREGRLTKIPNTFYKQVKNLENQIREVIEGAAEPVTALGTSPSHSRASAVLLDAWRGVARRERDAMESLDLATLAARVEANAEAMYYI